MGFSNPNQMVNDYYYQERYQYVNYIEKEMDKFKTDAVKRFYTLAHPSYAEEIASTIAFGYSNDLPEAMKIVDQLFLNEKHIAALTDDSELMRDLLYKERLEEEEYGSFY